MINFNNVKKYCNDDISLIENYEQAKNDTEHVWCCHHRQGVYMSITELKEFGWYYNCPADCLLFVTLEEHNRIHKHKKYKKESCETKHKKSVSHYKKPRSEFGKKFIEHYNLSINDNKILYDKERWFYRKNGL